jgi:hypothetical protein
MNKKLSIILGIIILIISITIVLTSHVVSSELIKTTDVYKQSLSAVRSSLGVIKYIGNPIDVGFKVKGYVEMRKSTDRTRNNTGEADFTYHIKGAKSEGDVYVYAERINGTWIIKGHMVEVDKPRLTINLLL